jgi:hypothetical protein
VEGTETEETAEVRPIVMTNKPRRVIVVHLGTERVIELENGPFKLFGKDTEYYEGWVMPQPLDPYGEPYHIVFTADRIVREA